MERFIFRTIQLSDVAGAIAIPAIDLTLTSNPVGSIEIDTPNQNAAQRLALRNIFTKAYVEDTTAGS